MRKSSRLAYIHKVVLFNILFFGFIMLYPPRLLELAGNNQAFHYYAGVGILTALFFEFAGIWYKSRFIYSIKGARDMAMPMWLKISIWPRLLISASVLGLAFRAMGFLENNDFLILILVLYAGLKEFWVRSHLLVPEDAIGFRDPRWKIWMSEFMLFLFACVSYAAFWEYYLLETPKVLLKAKYPQNFPFVAIIFLLFLFSILMPYLVEEYLRPKKRSHKILSVLSFLLPTAALIFQLFRMGFLDK